MSAPGFGELVVLAIIALLVFGPERLPEVARSVGKVVARFKQETAGTLDELKRAADVDTITTEFRSAASEVRSVGDAVGPIASPSRSRDATGSGSGQPVVAAGQAPFDPDAP